MSRRKIALIIFIVGIILVMTYVYFTSEFIMLSSTGIQKEYFDPKETYYFGHDMKWNGLVRPTVNTIYIIRNDGSMIREDEQKVKLTPFIDYSGHTGSLNEEAFKQLISQNLINYESVSNKLKNDEFTLVLKVEASTEQLDYNIKGIVINYRVLGVPKKQLFEYNGFLSD